MIDVLLGVVALPLICIAIFLSINWVVICGLLDTTLVLVFTWKTGFGGSAGLGGGASFGGAGASLGSSRGKSSGGGYGMSSATKGGY